MTEIHVGSLFSGIGGIDLGLERVGMIVKWQSEIEPYSCRVLKKHWPDVPNLGNIREVNWEEVERVDVIAGGYPCQPFSNAGKRGGSDDPRHLWPEMLRAISVLRPRVAFLENVRGHYSLGFDRVLGDLADIGYDCEWEIVSAQSVGAPHRRERLICLAYPNGSRRQGSVRTQETCEAISRLDYSSKAEGSSDQWVVEPDVGRVAHGIPARVDRLRGLGNAVVPQVAEVVGRVIMEMLAPL